MDLEKILKNAELEYGENIELVFYRDGSGHIAETGIYGVEDKDLFYFDYPCELELKFG
jgi:hypothetical protein